MKVGRTGAISHGGEMCDALRTLPSLSIDPRDKIQKNIFLGLDYFMIYEPRQDVICDCNPSWTPLWGFFEKNVISVNKIKLSLPHLYI